MSELDRQSGLGRRKLMKLAALGAAGTALAACTTARGGGIALASEATPGMAPVAFYRFKVGDFTITSINDGGFNFPTGAFGINAEEGAVAAFLQERALPAAVAPIPLQTLVIETGSQIVLMDTGMGPNVFPGDVPNNGRLIPTLELLGIRRDQVDVVLLSHAHPDHVGGNTTESGEAAFPNARYFLSATDLDFWTGRDGDANDVFFDFMLKVANANLRPIAAQVEELRDGQEVVPGITAMAAPGHTLGHMAFVIESKGDVLVNLVDTAVHYLVALEMPEWVLAADMDPDMALATRTRLLNQMASGRTRVFGYHFPFPGVGFVLGQDRWRFLPSQV